MSPLLQRVRRTIRRHDLLPAATRLLIGLSGGSDSVALTFLMRELAPHEGAVLVGLAHFNHRLRATADRDEAFCRALAHRLGLPIAVESAEVAAYAARQRLSLEEAARRLRYAFLAEAAKALGADRIAVGHTEDDQAETFLMKLARGAGLTGLGGIYPRRGQVIRPLLEVARAELRAYLEALGEGWVEDETNVELGNVRSRIRYRVLPELDRAYGGPTGPALARAAGLIREDAQLLDELSSRRYAVLASVRDGRIELNGAGLLAEPGPLARRVVLMALRQLAGGREIGLEHVESALDVLRGERGGADLPGSRVELRHGLLVLIQQGSPLK